MCVLQTEGMLERYNNIIIKRIIKSCPVSEQGKRKKIKKERRREEEKYVPQYRPNKILACLSDKKIWLI